MVMLSNNTTVMGGSHKSFLDCPCLYADIRKSEERGAWPFKGLGGGIMGTDA